jgi:hypothetical protein
MNPDHIDNTDPAGIPDEPGLDPLITALLSDGRAPSRELEDRVVRALRERALLRPPSTTRAHGVTPLRLRSRAVWFAGAAAAAVTFAVGVQVGERMNTIARDVPPSHESASSASASRVRRAAFEYITALSAVRNTDSAARAASVATFHSVTGQIVRLAPDGDIAAAIRAGLPSSFAMAPGAAAAAAPSKHVIWF